ncbi:MAG: hypothetical protein QOD42_3448 [Sphingomonadales bacterium]|jgi:hypothetical protein|nr:hypothetical protein [Sphingomonadales bacterium]
MLMLLALVAADPAPASAAAWNEVVESYSSLAACVTAGGRAQAGEIGAADDIGAAAAAACAPDQGRYEEAFAAWHGAGHAGEENADRNLQCMIARVRENMAERGAMAALAYRPLRPPSAFPSYPRSRPERRQDRASLPACAPGPA